MNIAEQVINMIIMACENQDDSLLDIATGIVENSDTKYKEQIKVLLVKVWEKAIYTEESVEFYLNSIESLLSIDAPSSSVGQEKIPISKHYVEDPQEETEDFAPLSQEYEDDFVDPIKTRGSSSPVNKGKRPNNFNPAEYANMFKDEDHQEHKAAARPAPKTPYEKTLITVQCAACGTSFKVPPAFYAGEDTRLKCDDCLR